MMSISREGNTWHEARKGKTLCVSLSWSGKYIVISNSDYDDIVITFEEAEALLAILPEAIAALKQNSA